LYLRQVNSASMKARRQASPPRPWKRADARWRSASRHPPVARHQRVASIEAVRGFLAAARECLAAVRLHEGGARMPGGGPRKPGGGPSPSRRCANLRRRSASIEAVREGLAAAVRLHRGDARMPGGGPPPVIRHPHVSFDWG
jgi:hypothetical protein